MDKVNLITVLAKNTKQRRQGNKFQFQMQAENPRKMFPGKNPHSQVGTQGLHVELGKRFFSLSAFLDGEESGTNFSRSSSRSSAPSVIRTGVLELRGRRQGKISLCQPDHPNLTSLESKIINQSAIETFPTTFSLIPLFVQIL